MKAKQSETVADNWTNLPYDQIATAQDACTLQSGERFHNLTTQLKNDYCYLACPVSFYFPPINRCKKSENRETSGRSVGSVTSPPTLSKPIGPLYTKSQNGFGSTKQIGRKSQKAQKTSCCNSARSPVAEGCELGRPRHVTSRRICPSLKT